MSFSDTPLAISPATKKRRAIERNRTAVSTANPGNAKTGLIIQL
jgi:hypothetical protein